jgi:hypothetical protein
VVVPINECDVSVWGCIKKQDNTVNINNVTLQQRTEDVCKSINADVTLSAVGGYIKANSISKIEIKYFLLETSLLGHSIYKSET